MSASESAVDERKKAARLHVRSLFERLSLPTSAKRISVLSVDDLKATAVRYNAPAEVMSRLENVSHDTLHEQVRKNFFHNRNTAVAAFLAADDSLSLSSIQGLLSWKDLTSVNVTVGSADDAGVHGRSLDGSLEASSSATSELASSPEIQQLLHTMQLMQEKLRILEEEKALAPDDDEDRSAGGRRIELLPAVLNLLPLDPVREELTKPSLASILRSYPLPSGYILKAGELSVDEKARLPALVAEEITKLGKIINRYTDVARPLLGLLNVLEQDSEAGSKLVSIAMVRSVVVHTLQLLFHHNSKLETERHLVHFKDEKVLQSVFQKAVRKPFFSDAEKAKLEAVAAEHKRLRKIKESLHGGKKTIKKKQQRPAPPLRARPSPESTSAPGGFDKGKNRHSKPAGGKGRGKGGKTGGVRGPEKTAAQDE
jgi:hypothetical protein